MQRKPLALRPAFALTLSLSSGLLACNEDPRYVQPAVAIESGAPDADPETPAFAQLIIPIRLETEKEAADRAELALSLGVDVPFVKLDDIDLSLEWSIRNLSDTGGQARILLNAANELFAYEPVSFVVDPEEEDEPPPLAGDIPILVPAQSTVSGVFREDELRELSIDLELITRGETNPFAAILQHNEGVKELTPLGLPAVPITSFASLTRLDITLQSNRHMVMEFALRVRSHVRPNLLHNEGLSAPPEELTEFMPMIFVPPPPEEP